MALEATDIRRRNNITERGDPAGRVLLFAHGFGCSQETWRLVVPFFEADYRILLFDHVGSGGSDLSAYDKGKYDSLHGYTDDVVEILESLDLTDVVFVGHSVSSMIGVLAANRPNSRISALALLGPSPRYVNTGDYVGGFDQPDIDNLLDSLDANYFGWSATMAPMIIGNPERPELGDELTGMFCSTDPTIARHFAHVTFLSDNRADLAAVTVPTLVMQAKDDIIAPTAVGEYVHAHVLGSTYTEIDAYGHCAQLSDPSEVARAIRAFLP